MGKLNIKIPIFQRIKLKALVSYLKRIQKKINGKITYNVDQKTRKSMELAVLQLTEIFVIEADAGFEITENTVKEVSTEELFEIANKTLDKLEEII